MPNASDSRQRHDLRSNNRPANAGKNRRIESIRFTAPKAAINESRNGVRSGADRSITVTSPFESGLGRDAA